MTHQRNLFPDDPEQQDMFDAQGQGDPPAARRPLTPADIDRVRDVAGFPIATDAAIIALSDPPHHTACPNPFLPEIVARWQQERDASGDADYHREPFAFDVSEGKNDPIYNAHSYHTKVPHKAIMRYILHYTQPGDIVFDGFCGTGMTGVAAQLCGDRTAVESLGYYVDSAGYIYERIPEELTPERKDAEAQRNVASLPPGDPASLRSNSDQPCSRVGARKAVLYDLANQAVPRPADAGARCAQGADCGRVRGIHKRQQERKFQWLILIPIPYR